MRNGNASSRLKTEPPLATDSSGLSFKRSQWCRARPEPKPVDTNTRISTETKSDQVKRRH